MKEDYEDIIIKKKKNYQDYWRDQFLLQEINQFLLREKNLMKDQFLFREIF